MKAYREVQALTRSASAAGSLILTRVYAGHEESIRLALRHAVIMEGANTPVEELR